MTVTDEQAQQISNGDCAFEWDGDEVEIDVLHQDLAADLLEARASSLKLTKAPAEAWAQRDYLAERNAAGDAQTTELYETIRNIKAERDALAASLERVTQIANDRTDSIIELNATVERVKAVPRITIEHGDVQQDAVFAAFLDAALNPEEKP